MAIAQKIAAWRGWKAGGYWVFGAISLLAWIRLLLQETPGHYRVFHIASRLLWSEVPAYGSDFGTQVGYYFYSPTCGLFFFRLFGFFPEAIGLSLFVGFGLALFLWGAQSWMRLLRFSFQKQQWFWFLIAPQFLGAILASKLEIWIVGAALLASAWWLEGRRWIWAGAIWALVCNWKFQPLPAFALMTTAVLMWKRDWKVLGSFLGFSLVWWGLPFLVLPAGYLVAAHEVWFSSLGAFVREAYLDFDNVFKTLKVLGWSMAYETSQVISVVMGFLMFLWVLWKRSAVDALALGFVFVSCFSPLAQNNAAVLYSPFLLLLLHRDLRWPAGIAWSVMAFSYGDFLPEAAADSLREFALKPAVLLLLVLSYWTLEFRRKTKASSLVD